MKPRARFIPVLLLLLTGGRLLAAQETAYVPARDYLTTAEREIDAAKSSIHVYQYLINYDAAAPASQPGRLLQALVRARKRGLQVEVLLNRATGVERAQGLANEDAVAFLRAEGVPVALTAGASMLHAKVLVADDRTVLAGSTNWSASAFSRNGEGNFLIRSTPTARAAVAELGAFPREPAPAPEESAIPVPEAFFTGGAFKEMVRRKDERSHDLYLYLLRLRAKSPAAEFIVDEKGLIEAFGYNGPRAVYRSPMLRDLRRLEKYGLITLTVVRAEEPRVRIADFPREGAVLVPAAYFDLRWDRRLPSSAKAFYLVSLRESMLSDLPHPLWSRSHETLAARYGMSRILTQGVPLLRRAGLLSVRYAPIKEGGGDRAPNVYRPLPLYDPVARDQAFQALEKKYLPAQVKRARDIAALVYADFDVGAIEHLIQLEQLHGRPAVDQALRVVSTKHPTSPTRSMNYLIGTIKGIAAREQEGDPDAMEGEK